jgi:diguanylate cyclase
MQWEGGPKDVTCSFGVTGFQSGDDQTILLKRADEALYRAKSSGKNRVEVKTKRS